MYELEEAMAEIDQEIEAAPRASAFGDPLLTASQRAAERPRDTSADIGKMHGGQDKSAPMRDTIGWIDEEASHQIFKQRDRRYSWTPTPSAVSGATRKPVTSLSKVSSPYSSCSKKAQGTHGESRTSETVDRLGKLSSRVHVTRTKPNLLDCWFVVFKKVIQRSSH